MLNSSTTSSWLSFLSAISVAGLVGGVFLGVRELAANRYLAANLDWLALTTLSEQVRRGFFWIGLSAAILLLLPWVTCLLARRSPRRIWRRLLLPASALSAVGILAFVNRTYFLRQWIRHSREFPAVPEALFDLQVWLTNAVIVLFAGGAFLIFRSSLRQIRQDRSRSMTPLWVLIGAVALPITVHAVASWLGPIPPVGTPSVILISFDTCRADRIGVYGNSQARTPTLDKLGSQGTLWTTAVTAAPTTLAAHAALFTSRVPHSMGVLRNGFPIPASSVTLAEVMKDQGFTTAGFVASFVLGGQFGVAQSFDHFVDSLDIRSRQANLQYRRAGSVNDSVYDWLGRRPDGPLFLFVHYYDPHPPFHPPRPFDRIHRSGYDGPVQGGLSDRVSARARLKETNIPDKDCKRLLELHDGEVAYADRELGRLFNELQQSGLLESAVVVFLADHGETFWNHAYDSMDHGLAVFDSTTHIPFLIWQSENKTGSLRTDTAHTIDVAPTVLAASVQSSWPSFLGRDLFDIPSGPHESRHVTFSEATEAGQVVRRRSVGEPWANRPNARYARDTRYKLIETPHRGGLKELYDLAADPGEFQNLLTPEPPRELNEIYLQLQNRLTEWVHQTRTSPELDEPEDLDEGTREQLRALGYL